MRIVDLIDKKRYGGAHDRAELAALVMGYVRGEVPDYQVAAWLMAVCCAGMTPQETAELTDVMARSGDLLELSELPHTVDKHSTGGVGDKTSLIVAPLLAACGATVAKMSGRGLGHTGGTIDKLESIPGFQAALARAAFMRQAREVGVVISGQSADLAPADGLLYALRDATATVAALPLIASSVMSKKLAGGAQTIVLDVKVGSGAFMKTIDEARELARAMIDIGSRHGRGMRAVLSSMQQPLGQAVGHALEVQEALACLRGEGPGDLLELCLVLAEQVLEAAGLNTPRQQVIHALESGAALAKFHAWITAQGGEVTALKRLELAPDQHLLRALAGGYLARLDALLIGQSVKALGGGRDQKSDPLDLGVGVVLHAKLGDEVAAGEPLLTVYYRGGKGLDEALHRLTEAIRVSPERVTPPPLVLELL
ncbi:MAG: thymidine phosphorylase [Truepera sp.]|nr:thymidine phosphorylase [Truepera sp.]